MQYGPFSEANGMEQSPLWEANSMERYSPWKPNHHSIILEIFPSLCDKIFSLSASKFCPCELKNPVYILAISISKIYFNTYISSLRVSLQWHRTFRPGTHYSHVTWAHVMLRVLLGCERRFNIEFYGANSHFCHSAYVTWSHVKICSAHVPARLSRADGMWGDLTLNSMAQIHTSITLLTSRDLTWSFGRHTCQHASHVCRPDLHVSSRDVSRVTEVLICAIEFNVKSPLTSQPHA